MNNIFSEEAWEEYTYWQIKDRTMLKKINDLIKSIMRDGMLNGLGKPEKLKYREAYSRRITDEHRLVYNSDIHNNLIIYLCKGHYED